MTDLLDAPPLGGADPAREQRSSHVHLRREGVSVLLENDPAGLPAVLHWGGDLGELSDAALLEIGAMTRRQTPPQTLDTVWQASLLPVEGDVWAGRPGLQLSRGGLPLRARWGGADVRPDEDGTAVTVVAEDVANGVRLSTRIAIDAGGVVTVVHSVACAEGADPVVVDWVEATLPAPKAVDHLTTFSGRWTREKAPQTALIPRGSTLRQTRRGRGGHDAPMLHLVSIDPPRDRDGSLWAVHLGWSADCSYRNDRLPDSSNVIGAGELLRAGEIHLEGGESYTTPTAYFAWSDAGLDGLAARFHRSQRARPQHPRTPRPLVLNTWEAVYFDHDPAFLHTLADLAAEVGVERFVLDDGWFLGRRDDRRGLGDWHVDRTVWPDGLEPLARHVHSLGMEFGLWFEPEMVNLDTDLARAHPDWLLHDPAHVPTPQHLSLRSQYVLDLANLEAYAHLLERIDALVGEIGVDFIKWDHNRDLVESTHHGRPGTHLQTEALYRLMGELKSRNPGLEIESCSSGGARSDLGVLAVADRVWASDSNDPLERQDIQRWTQLLLAPELVGGHVGPTTAHSSGRTTALSYRLATSLMGSAGFEWNILECTEEERATITRWAALYKELRWVIHTGSAVHADPRDPALRVVGAVAPGLGEGVWTIATVATMEDSLPERIRLLGLDLDADYRVRVRDEIGTSLHGFATPEWLSAGGFTASGRVLATLGVQIPPLWPAQALVLHAVRLGG
ncbi:alpha-galactosidase [Rathayibacter sp. PhB127]|uniref:alpha-galactosidase n=1 Tax=Rathayibacter sp. PhB127 TaxID=2485176 RepID=UPI000F9B892D|nr:alpha-galactosidase [Rathayibacter sp. PhB127]ROS21564.1 alpha-galactosidase [Rathayibacter sp. PhB127]